MLVINVCPVEQCRSLRRLKYLLNNAVTQTLFRFKETDQYAFRHKDKLTLKIRYGRTNVLQ